MQANAYNVALLNGGMGDGSQLLQVDQSGVMYNNLVPLGKCHFVCVVVMNECRCSFLTTYFLADLWLGIIVLSAC